MSRRPRVGRTSSSGRWPSICARAQAAVRSDDRRQSPRLSRRACIRGRTCSTAGVADPVSGTVQRLSAGDVSDFGAGAASSNQELVSYSLDLPERRHQRALVVLEHSDVHRARLAGPAGSGAADKQIGYYSDMYKLEFALPKFRMYRRDPGEGAGRGLRDRPRLERSRRRSPWAGRCCVGMSETIFGAVRHGNTSGLIRGGEIDESSCDPTGALAQSIQNATADRVDGRIEAMVVEVAN